ncbi:hypothetical protein [Burkholderia multivorans]|uniref:hypothetical protein n=1 Tax=Burkholderia multivorans TaxID=87883 RepID=UPI001C22613E|nr:hypothetical protein [Burkholderia multivorans]MDN8079061.1 hypothetical protein [Burkholderia multivorans]
MISLHGKRAIIVGAVVALGAVLAAGTAINLLLTPPHFEVSPQGTKEAPAQSAGASASAPLPAPGCWAVSATDTTLKAMWEPVCSAPPVIGSVVQGWPTNTLRLPASTTDGTPDMRTAQTEVALSSDVAQFGEGALLYLPTGADGSGYYVAGWRADSSAESSQPGIRKGIEIGRYGAPPLSIETPSGYVYLTPEFAPKRHQAMQRHSDDEDPANTSDEPDSDRDMVDDSDASAASSSSVRAN